MSARNGTSWSGRCEVLTDKELPMGSYAGVDWAADKHEVRVADETGQKLLAATFAHDEAGLRALCRQLVRLGVELVAIERPDGLLVERLLDAGLRVLALHPNQVAATRARFRVSGGKSDRFDAFVLCELARTDSHRFRVLEPDTDQTKALRALTRAREGLVKTRVAVSNQLRAELERFWPGPIGLFTDLDSPISLAFLENYPSPAGARSLGEKRLAAFLTRQHYSGGQKPAQLLAKLKRAPEGRVGKVEMNARRQARCSVWCRRSRRSPRRSRRSTDRSRTRCARIRMVRSSCRCSRTPTASSPPPRWWPRWATAAGATPPVTRSPATPARRRSRSSPANARPRASAGAATSACAPRFAGWRTQPRHWHPWAQDLYAAARDRGHDHPRALRTLGRAWCRIVWRCWQDGVPYDPTRHRALQRHVTVTIPTPSDSMPDTAATQRMLGEAVTQRAARRDERAALDDKPTSAIAHGG